jgi:hypothetical protein
LITKDESKNNGRTSKNKGARARAGRKKRERELEFIGGFNPGW